MTDTQLRGLRNLHRDLYEHERYNIINADNEIIGSIVANGIKSAADKLNFKFGKSACFLRLEKER